MQITDVNTFLDYYSGIKSRTMRLFPLIPPDKIEWTYRPGKFTFGELIRHLGAIERWMYAETVQMRPAKYTGCGTNLAEGYGATIDFYKKMHEDSMQIFRSLTAEDLMKKCKTPAGIDITVWKWLRAMVEHEIHHRGQIYTYLGILDIDVPPIFGLTSEQVAERGKENV
ncbi:MAG TPA: DinB family protein [Saprospiraceae bacterium]|nr:DinB family protein [Saprospiraceae bacterium]